MPELSEAFPEFDAGELATLTATFAEWYGL